jgi:hypothetical protein
LKGQGQDPSAVLEQSTLRGWRGIFPLAKVNGSEADVNKLIAEIEAEDKKRATH